MTNIIIIYGNNEFVYRFEIYLQKKKKKISKYQRFDENTNNIKNYYKKKKFYLRRVVYAIYIVSARMRIYIKTLYVSRRFNIT